MQILTGIVEMISQDNLTMTSVILGIILSLFAIIGTLWKSVFLPVIGMVFKKNKIVKVKENKTMEVVENKNKEDKMEKIEQTKIMYSAEELMAAKECPVELESLILDVLNASLSKSDLSVVLGRAFGFAEVENIISSSQRLSESFVSSLLYANQKQMFKEFMEECQKQNETLKGRVEDALKKIK